LSTGNKERNYLEYSVAFYFLLFLWDSWNGQKNVTFQEFGGGFGGIVGGKIKGMAVRFMTADGIQTKFAMGRRIERLGREESEGERKKIRGNTVIFNKILS